MNRDSQKVSMSRVSSTITRNVSDGFSDQFPAGLRVLLVEDDPKCSKLLESQLRSCLYEVTTCTRAEDALSILRDGKSQFDIVLSDVHLPEMDGFELLKHIGLEMNLPVIMISGDDKKDVVMKSVKYGACDCLIKPIRMETIKNIWQHVVRKRRNELKELEQSGSLEDSDHHHYKPSDDAEYASSVSEGRNSKRKKDGEEEGEDKDDTSTLKKPRVVWSAELHDQFVAAVCQLGIDRAVPKKILEVMNVPGLTRENVASHLQKYRMYLKRLSHEVSQHQSGPNMPFMGPQEENFSSLDGLNLQALAFSGQLPPQSLATLQRVGLGGSNTNTGISNSLADYRNIFFETSMLRYGEGQLLSNSDKQVNLLQRLPTTMEPNQVDLPHSIQSFGNTAPQVLPTMSLRTRLSTQVDSVHGNKSRSLIMQMARSWSGGESLNEIAGGHAPELPSSIGQQISSNEILGQVLQRTGAVYNPVSQTPSVVDFPLNHMMELPRNGFPLASTTKVSTGMFEERESMELKRLRGFASSYDFSNELRLDKIQDWELPNVGLTFEVSQHVNSKQGNPDISPSVLSNQSFSYSQENGQYVNGSIVDETTVSWGEANEHQSTENSAEQLTNPLADNSIRVKNEAIPDLCCENMLLPEHFGQDDLMSTLLKHVNFL